MKNVIIVGGGFAGVRAALTLKDKIKTSDIKIILIDRNTFHTFTPSLYEVATAEESQQNVRIPYGAIFNHKIEIIHGEVQEIDSLKKIIFFESFGETGEKKELVYDYLIFALGSQAEDFGIEGIKEHGLTLKTLSDAVRIKNALKTARKVIVGGGGFSGTELACELTVNRKYLNVVMIHGADVLLKELDREVSRLAKERLEKAGVKLILGERIKRVTATIVETVSGRIFPYDVFIWTGGVRSNKLLGDIKVDGSLRVDNQRDIFAAGDASVPGVAPKAEEMGKIAAENVLRSIKRESLVNFSYRQTGYVIPLGSHFAVFTIGKYHISGIFAYIIKHLILLHYLLQILPLLEALRRFRKFEKDLGTFAS